MLIFARCAKISDLHHRERLQMDLRKPLLQAAQHLAIPIERQLRMQAAHDVELGDRFAVAVAGAFPDLFERHGVRLGILGALSESAQAATGDADIGRIDVAVDVEIGDVAVQALAHAIRHPADAQQIGRAVERHAVVETQAFAGVRLFANRLEAGVVKWRNQFQF